MSREEMETFLEEFCDNYCKWPDKYEGYYVIDNKPAQEALEDRCKECPLSNLLEDCNENSF